MKRKLSWRGIWQITKDTFTGFSEDKVTKLSGSLAYYMVFSMGPLLVVIISLCGLLLSREAIEGKVYDVLVGFVGSDTAAQLQEIIRNASVGDKSFIAAVIGIVTLLIGATSVFAEIQDSINMIWGLKPKPKKGWLKYLQNRFLSFSIIVSLGFLLLVSLALSAIIEGISTGLQARFPGVAVVVFYMINLLLTIGISTLIFATIFKVLPDARIKWRDVFAGAIVTAVLFLIGKFAISLYISQTQVGSTYGAAGSLVVLLVWVYYSSIILYLGAEFTKAYALMYGSAIHPNDYAVTMKQVEVEMGHQTIQEKENKIQSKI
ncbi:MAG TPA: YihY/virulence factor BrkB family protein [Chitinophagaceae bacterium]|nr:YihY/virulence factor BrkB family protein [Chitinophagaceae bacterium]